jgi:dynein heavy chain
MCVKLQMAEGKIAEADYDFFLRGGGGMGDQGGPKEPKPALDWIKQTTWDQLLDLQKNPGTAWAAGIAQAVSYGQKEWRHWYQSTNPEPEEAQLPGEWLQKCEDPVKKMIILRCFRPDRVNFAIRNFVKQRMNSDEFIQSRPTSIAEIVGDSNPFQPVLFVLTQGTDPTAAL